MSKKIRIAHLQLLPLLSGVQRVTLEELKRLDRRVFEPYIVCKEPGPLSEAAAQEGITCLFISDLVREISPKRDWRALWRLRGICREYGFHIVHTHSSKTGILGRLAGRLAGVPVVMHTVHGYAFPAARNYLERIFYLALEWVGARFCDAMILLKEDDRRLAKKYLWMKPNQLQLLPNGIDTEMYCPRAEDEKKRIRQDLLKINGAKIAIGMVGRLWRQKNPLCLVSAAASVLKIYSNVHFFLIGDGELRPEVEKLITDTGISDNVTLLGWRNDVPNLLGGLDIFVLPSRWEGLPLAILEAEASGVPVVASDIPGNRDAIIPGTDGLLFPDNNEGALSEALQSLISDRQGRQKMGTSGRNKVLENYCINKRVDKMEAVYKKLFLEKGGKLT